jgi:hypothetical protein
MKALILRTCKNDLTSYNGFKWPKKGYVECPDWDPKPKCGNGLHGLLWGEGDGCLLNWSEGAKWQVVEVDLEKCVEIGQKVKFPCGNIVYTGDQISATKYILEHGGFGKTIVGANVVVGNNQNAVAGYRGTATAGNYGIATAGYYGKATAGNYGTATVGHSGIAIAGDAGTATAGDAGTAIAGIGGKATASTCGTATAGNGGTATAGNNGTATAGENGIATAGNGGTATAGNSGKIQIEWYDGVRCRTTIGYIGEDGIKANVAYKCNEKGKLIKVENAKL